MIKNNNISEFLILIPFALKLKTVLNFILLYLFYKQKLVEVVVVTVILIVSVKCSSTYVHELSVSSEIVRC